jgi:hypothetical protein
MGNCVWAYGLEWESGDSWLCRSVGSSAAGPRQRSHSWLQASSRTAMNFWCLRHQRLSETADYCSLGHEKHIHHEDRGRTSFETLVRAYQSISYHKQDNNIIFLITFGRKTKINKLHGLSPRANYTDRATAACRRSDCQLLRIKGATWGQRDGSVRPYSRLQKSNNAGNLITKQTESQLFGNKATESCNLWRGGHCPTQPQASCRSRTCNKQVSVSHFVLRLMSCETVKTTDDAHWFVFIFNGVRCILLRYNNR